jgi:hypothetical protein
MAQLFTHIRISNPTDFTHSHQHSRHASLPRSRMPNLWQIRHIDDHQENVDLVQVAVLAIMNIGIDCVSPSN